MAERDMPYLLYAKTDGFPILLYRIWDGGSSSLRSSMRTANTACRFG
ncbi:hypothetical protein ACVSQB_38620 [Bradyrhizobium elkanii]